MSVSPSSLDGLRIERQAATRRKPPWLPIGAVGVVILGLAGAFWAFAGADPAPVRTIIVARPALGAAGATLLNASGYVTARRKATVSSKVTGMVIEVLVEEGMEVTAGQVLARLDAANVDKNLDLAEAQKDSARKALDESAALLERSERDLDRLTPLADADFESAAGLDGAATEAESQRARWQRQQAELEVAERQVALWRQQRDDTVIRAPFAGVVTSKNAQQGEMISPMSSGGFTRTGICTIVDMDSLEIEVDVSESYINRVRPGAPVLATLDSYPDWRIRAHVIAIIPTADRQKATVKVRIGFDEQDARILPDMSVKVAFQEAKSPRGAEAAAPRVTIPLSALRRHEDREVVFVVVDDRVQRRAVTVSDRFSDELSLSSGLQGGERLVVEGPDTLQEGDPVMEKDDE